MVRLHECKVWSLQCISRCRVGSSSPPSTYRSQAIPQPLATLDYLASRAVCDPPPPPNHWPIEATLSVKWLLSGPPAIIVVLTEGSLGQRLRSLVAAQTLGVATGRGVFMVWGSPDQTACSLPFRELFDVPSSALKVGEA